MRLRPVPFIALALALVLVTAIGSAAILHQPDEQADNLARDQLAAASFDVRAVGVATDHRVAVVLSISSDVQAAVVDATVDGDGWAAVHGKAVSLVRSVDCSAAPPQPRAASAVLELHGQRRTIDLLSDPKVFDVVLSTGREACGDVDATRAVRLKVTPAVRTGKVLTFALTVSNRSAHPVTVRLVNVIGARVQSVRPLVPLVVAARGTGSIRVAVTGPCKGPPTDEVTVSLDGRGGRGTSTVVSPRLRAVLGELCR